MHKALIVFIVAMLVWFPTSQTSAQEESPYPVYVVQTGDSLYSIAIRFGVTVTDLIDSNQITDPNQIVAGMQLKIPGLEGLSGILLAENIPLGVDMVGLTRYRNIDEALLVKLNRITSPSEVYAGVNLIVPQLEGTNYRKFIEPLAEKDSLIGHAAAINANPWEIALTNHAKSTTGLLPEELLFLPAAEASPPPNPLAPKVSSIDLSPLPLVQGHTFTIRVTTNQEMTLSGYLNDMPLHFMQEASNQYVAIQGIHALADPGLAEFSFTAADAQGYSAGFSQMLLLQQGYYAQDPPLNVDPITLDEAYTKPEEELVRQAITPVTPEKLWQGIFRLPVDEPFCIKSWYGNRRSYNGGPYIFFHTGLDYGVCVTRNIYSPAPGVVVFSGPLTVRGIATIIDHGWGIYSGFWHQQESMVSQGDRVEAGQLIGLIGGTGRATGPHLHWEVWANGIQVEPQTWLDREFP